MNASDAPPPTQTAVIVPVPAADSLVDERRHLDVAASWGVPAHVSVLYPFVEPAQVDDHLATTLAGVFGSVPAFDCRFPRTQWFGQDVLWLDPEPAQPFRDLIAAVWDDFPHHPPYGGAHDDVVPHLTIAERRLGSLLGGGDRIPSAAGGDDGQVHSVQDCGHSGLGAG